MTRQDGTLYAPHFAGVLGSPIGHSLSPVLHRAAYAELGLTEWRYESHEVDEAALPGFFARLPDAARDAGWAGFSLTMPLKRAVIPLLDEISDTAASVEAVNTVTFGPKLSPKGDNTDIPGMVAALAERGWTPSSRRPSSARVPPPRPRWPHWRACARDRSPRTCAARPARPRCAAGASGSGWTSARPRGPKPPTRSTRSW